MLVNRPRVLLMDEPFAALDAQNRLAMQQLLLSLWRELHMTVVFVTHDVDEAVFLSDRVIVLTARPARVQADFSVALPSTDMVGPFKACRDIFFMRFLLSGLSASEGNARSGSCDGGSD